MDVKRFKFVFYLRLDDQLRRSQFDCTVRRIFVICGFVYAKNNEYEPFVYRDKNEEVLKITLDS